MNAPDDLDEIHPELPRDGRRRNRFARRRRPSRFFLPLLLLGALAAAFLYLGAPARALKLSLLVRPRLPRTAAPETPPAPPAPELAPTALYEGTGSVAVLMYHDVTEKPSVYFDVSLADFRRQLKELKAAGAHVIPIQDLYEHLRSGKQLPERPVVLTFDDCYLGQYEVAYPLLKEYGYPATFFVHTSVVGIKTGKDHMTWEQLRALDKEGLISIQCHTVTHPDDLRKCSDTQLAKELNESKRVLEEKLGHRVPFLAYPVGNADARVARVAREAGYDMAFTMGPGWAASPEDAFFVPRFLPRYLPEICERLKDGELTATIRPRLVDLKPLPLESGVEEDGQVHLRWLRGGRLSGLRMLGRRAVPEMVRAAGASGGLNGTFFSDARVNSAGSGIVGPVTSRLGPGFAPGLPGDRERIAGRPLVVISPEKMAFLPFRPHLALDQAGVERLLPGATDSFVAGAWLVHEGRPLSHAELETFRLSNVFDFRPRAFMGVDAEGRPFLGASSTGNQSDRLAETLAKLDLKECVLLDSGFSTSLVLGQEVLVSGIRRADMPARPVPHFLLLHPLDPASGKEVLAMRKVPPDFMGPVDVPSLERLQEQLSSAEQMTELEQTPSSAPQPRRRRRHRGRR